jgi:4'-phosphopantetheinyl transferase
MIAQVSQWLQPPRRLTLSRRVVHVWQAAVEITSGCSDRLFAFLSAGEHERAGRFHFDRDRRRFIVGHGVLRAILGSYLGVHPGQVQFAYGPKGKPSLAGSFEESDLRFNMSDSHGLAIYAFTRGREVGIDLEHIRPVPDAEQIAERYFTRGESSTLLSLPPDQRMEAFFNCWTRKEAFIKALGEGLAHSLDDFEVSLVPREPARLIRIGNDRGESSRWCLQALTPAPDMVAALAVEGHDWRLDSWKWSEDQLISVMDEEKSAHLRGFDDDRENPPSVLDADESHSTSSSVKASRRNSA